MRMFPNGNIDFEVMPWRSNALRDLQVDHDITQQEIAKYLNMNRKRLPTL